MKYYLQKLAVLLFLLIGASTVNAATVNVFNNTDKPLNVYVVNANNVWTFWSTVQPKVGSSGGSTAMTGLSQGQQVGVADPNKSGVVFLKTKTAGFLTQNITISQSDISTGPNPLPNPNPNPGPNSGRKIQVLNRSSSQLNVYTNDSGNWQKMATLNGGFQQTFDTKNGSTWGFDDPGTFGISLIKQTVVKVFDISPKLSIANSELNSGPSPIPNPGPNPGPGPINTGNKDVRMINRTANSVAIYTSNDGANWSWKANLASNSDRTFQNCPIGTFWGFAENGSITKRLKVSNLASNELTLSPTGGGNGNGFNWGNGIFGGNNSTSPGDTGVTFGN